MGHPVLFLFVLGYSFVSFFYLWDWQLNDAWRAPLRAQARANTFANSEGAVSALDVRKLNWLMCSKSSSHSLASSNSGPKHWLSYCLYITKVSCNLVPVIAVIYLNFTIVSQFYWYVLLKIVICFPSKEKKKIQSSLQNAIYKDLVSSAWAQVIRNKINCFSSGDMFILSWVVPVESDKTTDARNPWWAP